jgi:hypothetical protein
MIFVAFMIVTYVVATTIFKQETESVQAMVKKMLASTTVSPEVNIPHIDPIPMPKLTLGDDQAKNLAASETHNTYSLSVNSIPSGAEIFINGAPTGKTTPSMLEVPADSSYTISMKLDHYLEYVKTGLTKDVTGRTFAATLQQAMVGYVDIDVKPPVNVRVSVNGQILSKSMLPILNYAIPANVPVHVRAEDIVTGVVKEQTIKLLIDQHYSIFFDLNKNRGPAGR